MYASVTPAEVQAGKMDECIQLWEGSVVPGVKQLKGVTDGYLLTDRTTNRILSIIIYETEGDFRTTETSGRYRELVGMVASVLVPGSFGRQGYEVSSRIKF